MKFLNALNFLESNQEMNSMNTEKEDRNFTSKKKYLHIQILSEEKDKVNIKIPLALSKLLLKKDSRLNTKFSEKNNIDLEEVIKVLDETQSEELVDIESSNGDIVKIFIR